MKKNCSLIMDRFLELDKHQALPLKLSLHLLACKKCRTQVRLMTLAQKTCSHALSVPTSDEDKAIILLMQKIDPNYKPDTPVNHISMRRWIFSGLAMIAGMLFFMVYSKSLNNSALDIAFYCFFACAICAYCAIFVGSNMDFFVKKIETLNEHNLALKN